MIKKLKEIKLTRRGIYIALAVSMLTFGAIGIYTAVKNMDKIIEDTDFVYTDKESEEIKINTDFFNGLTNEEVSSEINEPVPVVLEFIMPVEGEILKSYSNSELVYSETMNDYRTHVGIDIIASDGDAVIASESGVITNVENHPLWGTSVEIEHANGIVTCYKNLSENLPEGIEKGSYIASGGVIGTVGSTALVEIGEDSHLHFEMKVHGMSVDPLEYLI